MKAAASAFPDLSTSWLLTVLKNNEPDLSAVPLSWWDDFEGRRHRVSAEEVLSGDGFLFDLFSDVEPVLYNPTSEALVALLREYETLLDLIARGSGEDATVVRASVLAALSRRGFTRYGGQEGATAVLEADARRRAYAYLTALAATPAFVEDLDQSMRTALSQSMLQVGSVLTDAVTAAVQSLPGRDQRLVVVGAMEWSEEDFFSYLVEPRHVGGLDAAALVLLLGGTEHPDVCATSSLGCEFLVRAGGVVDHAALQDSDTSAVLETALVLRSGAGCSVEEALVAARAMEG